MCDNERFISIMKQKDKVLLLIFSGTGNTLTVGNMIAEHFGEKGFITDIIEIGNPFPKIENIEDYRFIGFGYPVHAFNIPKIYRRLIAYLPNTSETSAFIFKTSGEPFLLNSASSYILTKKLKRKGYKVLSDTHFLMPYNIIFRYPDRAVKAMVNYGETLSKILVNNLLNGKQELIKYKRRYRLISTVFRIQYLGATINGLLIKVRRKKCNKCLRCLKNCPTGNIFIKDGKIKFSSKCTMCMRCAMMCPNDAIKIGFLNRWKVNGKYDFTQILANDSIEDGFFSEQHTDFFRYFKKYYNELDNKIIQAKLRS